jgi:hypothetical protein
MSLQRNQGDYMKKFILLYKGPATPMEQMSEEQSQKIMAGWQAWMQKLGDALVDMGQPMVNGSVVVDDGSSGNPSDFTGYSLVQADTMDEALKLVDGHPFLSDKSGKFSIEVFELKPLPM